MGQSQNGEDAMRGVDDIEPPGSVRCATVQFEPRAGDKDYNLGRVRFFVDTALAQGVQLVSFPEMCTVGYWHLRNLSEPQLRELAEPLDGPTIGTVRQWAADHGIGIGVGFLEAADGGRMFNSYAVCLPDGTVHRHRKLHSFEHQAIASGDTFTVFDTPWGVRLAILICYDNNIVENVRVVALAGAEVLIAPHQTGGTNSRSPYGMKPIPLALWENRVAQPQPVRDAFQGPSGREWLMRWLPSRAHDNGVFLVFSNGVGRDDDELRTGNAMILDPYGRVIAESTAIHDDMVSADLNLSLLPLSTGRRWIQGRRPELYGTLTQRTGHERDARAARFSAEPVPAPSYGMPTPATVATAEGHER
jgi:5-aminopentanamidase